MISYIRFELTQTVSFTLAIQYAKPGNSFTQDKVYRIYVLRREEDILVGLTYSQRISDI